LEEETVEDKKPREGRLERNLEAPGGIGFESDGQEEELSMELKSKRKPEREGVDPQV
jgi:hypothetical protein